MPSPVVRRYVSWNTSGCASRLPHRTVDTRTSWAPQGSSCAWGIVNDHVLGASCISRGEHSCKGFFGDWHREMAWEGLTTPIKERKVSSFPSKKKKKALFILTSVLLKSTPWSLLHRPMGQFSVKSRPIGCWRQSHYSKAEPPTGPRGFIPSGQGAVGGLS